MFTFFFTEMPVIDWDSAKKSNTDQFKSFFHHMLENGVYLAPSQFEAGFVSYARLGRRCAVYREHRQGVLQERKNLTAEKTTTAPKKRRLSAIVAR